jgi:chromosome segregation ATPase
MLEEIKENSGPVINGTSSKLWPLAEEFGELMKELRATKEVLVEKEEEVKDLISERNNTRLLLEHLECLVSRHERSLRMTVRRQTTTAGMSSEEEVLKALKSLFEHHKALDEKVRERLRTALERNSILEDELLLANQDIKALQDELDRFRRRFKERSRSSVRLSLSLEDRGFSIDQLALLGEKEQEIDDLQFQLDELTAKLEETCGVRDEYDKRVAILEEEVAMLMKDLHKDHNAQQLAKQKMEEIEEFKSKMESTVMELKSKLSDSCNALTHLQDENKVLRDKIAEKETKNIKLEDVVLDLQASLDERVCEVHHFEAEVRHWERRHSEELLKCEEKTDNAEQRIRELEVDLDAKGRELASYQEKLHMKENHIARLSSTVDRMLKESNEWMKMAAEEKKSLLDEKKLYSDKFTTTNRKLAKQKAISVSGVSGVPFVHFFFSECHL